MWTEINPFSLKRSFCQGTFYHSNNNNKLRQLHLGFRLGHGQYSQGRCQGHCRGSEDGPEHKEERSAPWLGVVDMSVIPDFRRLSKKDPKREVRMDYRVRSCPTQGWPDGSRNKKTFCQHRQPKFDPRELSMEERTDWQKLSSDNHTYNMYVDMYTCVHIHTL